MTHINAPAPEAVKCPVCGSDKTAPTKGNAVGNAMDCRRCGHDFTPNAPAEREEQAMPTPEEFRRWMVAHRALLQEGNEKRTEIEQLRAALLTARREVEAIHSLRERVSLLTLGEASALRQAAHFLAEQRDGMLSTKWPEDANPWRELAPTLRRLADKLESQRAATPERDTREPR